jgi:insertion element IS1 protein InsB
MQRLEVEADAMTSFVQKKANKQWIWLATDAKTRQVIAFYVGDRSRTSADQSTTTRRAGGLRMPP